MLARSRRFDRTEVLAAADRARARGRTRRAIDGYRRVLAADPSDATVHGKLAPLLVRTGRRAEALASFRAAADGHRRAGYPDRAVAVLRQAARVFPEELALWEEAARLQLERGKRSDAIDLLLEAGARLARTRLRPHGIRLARRALALEPWHFEGTLLYARLLVLDGRRRDAVRLLDGLGERTSGRLRRRARRAAFRLAPTPLRLWRVLVPSPGWRGR